MILGVGSDIVQHDKNIKLLKWDAEGNFPNRILSSQELVIFNNHHSKDNFIAGRFAAKEAVLKCLGTGMKDGISLKDIEIINSKSGKPNVYLFGEVKSICESVGINKWHITISHSENFTIAFAIAERVPL